MHAADRISFQKINSVVDMPNLLGLQRDSYRMFLQEDTLEDERKRIGLEEVFQNVFPIEDSHRNYILNIKIII